MKKKILIILLILFLVNMALFAQKISFKAENAPISMVLKSICKKHDLNLVFGSGVTNKRITLDLQEVSLDIALDMIAKAAGVAYDKQGNTILVDKPSHISGTGSKNFKLFKLNYAKADDLLNTIKGFKAVEAELNESENAIAVHAPVNTLVKIEEIINELDIPPKQVLIEAKLIEVSTDKLDSLGVNWDQLNSLTFNFAEGASGQTADRDALPSDMGYVDLDEFPSFTRQLKSFRMILDLILENGYGNILSNTKLMSMNNHEASVTIGDVIPYIVRTTNDGQITESVEKEEVGIKLTITPQISSEGKVTVSVVTEVSNIFGWKGENSEIPWIKTRKATTNVTLDDGQPLFIAGLRSQEEVYNTKGLFPLSKIPLLKYLFSYKKKTSKQTDLVIQITPKIVEKNDKDLNVDVENIMKKLKSKINDDKKDEKKENERIPESKR